MLAGASQSAGRLGSSRPAEAEADELDDDELEERLCAPEARTSCSRFRYFASFLLMPFSLF